jgi:hypothetical protein
VLPLAGQQRDALVFVQLHKLRQLEGEAFVIFADSVESLGEPMLLRWTTLVHRCRENVLADQSSALMTAVVVLAEEEKHR